MHSGRVTRIRGVAVELVMVTMEVGTVLDVIAVMMLLAAWGHNGWFVFVYFMCINSKTTFLVISQVTTVIF